MNRTFFGMMLLSVVLFIGLCPKGETPDTNQLSMENALKFDPSPQRVYTGQIFTTKVFLDNVSDLYGLQMTVTWNTTYLEYVDRTVTIPVESYPEGVLNAPDIMILEDAHWNITEHYSYWGEAIRGSYQLIYTSLYPASGFYGSGSVFTITFKALIQGMTTLNLTDIKLCNGYGELIPYEYVGDCAIEIVEDRIPPTITEVDWKPSCPFPYVPSNVPRPGEPIIVTANVTEPYDASGVSRVELSYVINGAEYAWNTTMIYNGTSNLWSATIPGQSANTAVEFYVMACDNARNTIASSLYAFNVKTTPMGDINGDSTVDIFDIILVAAHFGETS